MGDGTNLVVTFAGELLTQAEGLLRLGVHPSDIIDGYKKAAVKAQEALEAVAGKKLENPRDKEALVAALRPGITSKHAGDDGMLAGLVADAVLTAMPPAPKAASVVVDHIRVAKMIGGTIADSSIVKGVVVQRAAEGSVKAASRAKIAVFGCSIEAAAPETRGVVVIKTADELKAYNKGEEKLMEDSIKAIAETGAKVVVAGGSVSEIALHFLEKYGLMVVKVVSKFELRRLCQAVHAKALVRLGAPTEDELGYADSVAVTDLSSRLVTVFRQEEEESAVATIVLRGATMNTLDDMERAIDDAVNTARQLCKDGRMVLGAGATEMSVAAAVAAYGASTPGLEQYAIKKYAEALEVVPRILAETSGLNATDVVTALHAAHAAGGAGASAGVDMDGEKMTIDAAAAGVWDCYATKASALRLASEVAATILRVDTIIMSKQAGGPKPRAPGAPDGDD